MPVHGEPVLTLVSSGDHAHLVDRMDDQALFAEVTAVLRDMVGPTVSAPTGISRHAWSSDPFARGTYSYLATGSDPQQYAMLAKASGPRLHLAGEHASAAYFGTVHGALSSGQDVAARILAMRRG